MRTVRTMLAAMLMAMACLLQQASATSFTTDQSDAWAVPDELGWGVLKVQRGSVIFAAMFVYDPTRTPIWYTATLTYAGNFVWTGDLKLTNGPWFGTVPFGGVTYRTVGTMTWTALTTTTGQLKYDVDGTFIVKNNVTRLFAGYDDFSGHFAGGIHETVTDCQNASLNRLFEEVGTLNITQNGQSIAIGTFPSEGGSCAYNGTLSQAGQMGSVIGTYACSSGEIGTFVTYEMQVNPFAVTGRFAASASNLPGCHSTGWFGGMRVTTF